MGGVRYAAFSLFLELSAATAVVASARHKLAKPTELSLYIGPMAVLVAAIASAVSFSPLRVAPAWKSSRDL